MPFDVYGVGNALVDIQARVSDELIRSHHLDKGIMTLVEEDQQQKLLAQLNGSPLNRCAGGSAANTIVGIADFGGRAAYCGKVSRDDIGTFFLQDMQQLGVSIDIEPAVSGDTGTCAVLITPDAQRTMLTHLGVSVTLSADDVQEEKIRASKYVYIEGYLLSGESTKAAAYRAMELAQKHDVRIALTASDPFLVNMLRDEIWQLVEGPVDLFFCNEQEAKSLTGLDDVIQCAHEIHRHARNVALTLGPKGSLLMHNGEAIPIEAAQVEAIDTTGAGDMYAAGVLYGITNSLTWRQAGHLASQAAGRIVAQLGARLKRKFTPDEIEQLQGEERCA
jgi:sugar/nucleoside kinase (ribokinase family)